MKQFLFILVMFCLGSQYAGAQEDSTWNKGFVDTALLGTWQMANPADMKMLRGMNDPFLRQEIIFKDRELYEVPRERHPWGWNFSYDKQEIEIADLDELWIRGYRLKYLDENKLILMVGKQEIIFNKVH
ncbi:MAG: hypothetical protein GC180_04265 [Bacteroidetes bacterium]|nr:hypothetical protein [Bacteroidota bacterium]